MGLVLLVFVFPVCVVAILRRRRTRANIAVPGVLAVYSVGSALWFLVGLIHSFAGVAGVAPEMKATLLAKGISELVNGVAFALLLHLPLLVAAYWIDRRLLSRE